MASEKGPCTGLQLVGHRWNEYFESEHASHPIHAEIEKIFDFLFAGPFELRYSRGRAEPHTYQDKGHQHTLQSADPQLGSQGNSEPVLLGQAPWHCQADSWLVAGIFQAQSRKHRGRGLGTQDCAHQLSGLTLDDGTAGSSQVHLGTKSGFVMPLGPYYSMGLARTGKPIQTNPA
ncbi:hypothetical protein Y1Q_0003965 [Alligator mississippiensis]|uniref:Uncharacterized protein n=1 Tax=Alligator mississippiensis TaxID=8496 RepID=A0A151PHD9_ALLMI|nr:hypothetical protein Y1Q_0003965 [Alligator mississippiensis]